MGALRAHPLRARPWLHRARQRHSARRARPAGGARRGYRGSAMGAHQRAGDNGECVDRARGRVVVSRAGARDLCLLSRHGGGASISTACPERDTSRPRLIRGAAKRRDLEFRRMAAGRGYRARDRWVDDRSVPVACARVSVWRDWGACVSYLRGPTALPTR
jgi:hypothetical protein